MVGAAQDGVLHERDQIPCMNFAIFNGRILQWQRPWGQIGTSGKAFLAECAQSTDTGALRCIFIGRAGRIHPAAASRGEEARQ